MRVNPVGKKIGDAAFIVAALGCPWPYPDQAVTLTHRIAANVGTLQDLVLSRELDAATVSTETRTVIAALQSAVNAFSLRQPRQAV